MRRLFVILSVAVTTLPAPARPDTTANAREELRAALKAQLPQLRANFADPERRAAAELRSRASYRRAMPGLSAHLGLSSIEYERLLGVLAGHQMRNMEANYRCALDDNCDPMTVHVGEYALNQGELLGLLGVEQTRRFNNYRDTLKERESVERWRGSLPGSLQLSDAQAEQLIEALGDERRTILEEWRQRGAEFTGTKTEYGTLFFPSDAQDAEQRLAEVEEFLRRQRDRAAQVLTAEQFAAFTQRQRDSLETWRGIWAFQQGMADTR